eukprot:159085_1
MCTQIQKITPQTSNKLKHTSQTSHINKTYKHHHLNHTGNTNNNPTTTWANTHNKHHTYKQDLQAQSPRPHVIYVPMQRAAQTVHHMDQIKEGAPPPFNPALLETNQISNHNGEGQKQQKYQQKQAQ